MTAGSSAARQLARAARTLLLLTGLSGPEEAVEAQSLPTATLAGRVSDESGAGLSGITIRLESKSLQGVRETSTSAGGDFFAALLPAGEYTVTFKADRMQTVTRTVSLPAASTVRLEERMRPAPVVATVDVEAGAPSASPIRSPTIEAHYEKKLVDRLPMDRTLRSIALLAPGVTENGPQGNTGTTNNRKALEISGGLSYSNVFLVNGVVVNENLRGQPYDLFIEDAIEETSVLTGNISAEYGRFTGGVVNAVTRSGGNDFHGSFRATLNNDRWTANDPYNSSLGADNRVDEVNSVYEETLGGAAWKDHVWFFAAGRQASVSDSRQTQLLPRDGDIDPAPTPYLHSFDERRLEGKLTASPLPAWNLVASYTDVRTDERNLTPAAGILLDTAGLVSREAPSSLLAINSSAVLSDRLFLEAQYSRRRFSLETSSPVDPDPIGGTVIIDPNRGFSAGFHAPQIVSQKPERYDNDSWSLKGVYFVPATPIGSHEIHSGYERFSESAERNFRVSGSDFWITQSPAIMRGTALFPTFRPGATQISWNPILQPSLGSDLVTDSGFLEDRIQLGRHFAFNLGVRYDHNRDRDSRGTLVSNSGLWSPRLSARFDPKGDGRFEVHAGYARYVDKLHDNVANAASPAASANLVWFYKGPCVNCDPSQPLVSADDALRILFGWFNAAGGTASIPTVSGTLPGISTAIAPGLKPQSSREFSVGAGVALGAGGFFRADFVERDYHDMYSRRIDLSTGKSPPVFGAVHDMLLVVNSENVKRSYTAVQTQFSWRLAPSLQAAGSYTWSRLTGNARGEGPAESALIAPFIDSYPEYREESWAFPTGYLSGRGQPQPAADQRHRARLWFVYDLAARWGGISAALVESYDSGLPYDAVGFIDAHNFVANPGYAEPPTLETYFFTSPGAFRTDDITRTDVALTFTFRLFGTAELFVRPEVWNLFNEKGVVAVDSTVLTARSPGSGLADFNPFTDKPVRGVNYELASTFGKPRGAADYQLPRTFRVGVGVRF
ncbi:MAG TPA: TonB-dependent receptor [Thermoanaerobaculia bacterium]|nr:TonB-dependent receptor [Thermoanaerobaculia bacterium]